MENDFKIIPTETYFEHLSLHQKSGQKSLIKKISVFLTELKENPMIGTGKPELLKGFSERKVYSRRIDQKHRLIYEVFEEEKRIELLSAWGHYDDK